MAIAENIWIFGVSDAAIYKWNKKESPEKRTGLKRTNRVDLSDKPLQRAGKTSKKDDY